MFTHVEIFGAFGCRAMTEKLLLCFIGIGTVLVCGAESRYTLWDPCTGNLGLSRM